jgi:hypothetical protein
MAPLQVGRVGYAPHAAGHEVPAAATESEIEAGVELIACEPGFQHLSADPPQTSPSRKKSSPSSARVTLAVPLPERMVDVLDGIQPEPVEAGTLRKADVRLQQVFRHLGILRDEVRQPAHPAPQWDQSRSPASRSGSSRHTSGVGLVFRAVSGVVVHHVQQHLDASFMRGGDQQGSLSSVFVAEPWLEGIKIIDPVAVKTPVLEPVAARRLRGSD